MAVRRRRDDQRSRVYKAEDTVFDRGSDSPDYQSLDECFDFLTELMLSDYYIELEGFPVIGLKSNNQNASWMRKTRMISLPPWARTRWVICHELAHALTDKTHPSAPAHGGSFCRHYVELVRITFGDQKAEDLLKGMTLGGCRVMDMEHINV